MCGFFPSNRCLLGAAVPSPGILERLDLGLRPPALRRTKQHVVGSLAVEQWIKVNQIHALGSNVLAEDLKVIAVVKMIGHRSKL